MQRGGLSDLDISIHAPRVGSDGVPIMQRRDRALFQSTLPVWGATSAQGPVLDHGAISIHAPRVGSDGLDFQSRCDGGISIHAPRVGSDCPLQRMCMAILHFNPRSPCGERPDNKAVFNKRLSISIHAPRVGSDSPLWQWRRARRISIHAPRVGSDVSPGQGIAYACGFQSTLPVWGATGGPGGGHQLGPISIHAPRVGSDEARLMSLSSRRISIHAPRVGSDPPRRSPTP